MTVILAANASAVFWSSSIVTNTSSWQIYRESNNISFNLSGSVDGEISPIEYHGRELSPYYSYFADVGSNDVELKERTSALAGRYRSQEDMQLQSAIENAVEITVVKPKGSDIYTFSYYEQWPAFLRSSKTMEYYGQQINDRDLESNNGNFAGSKLLYNQEFYKDRRAVMWLQRMNATVLATNETIVQADFKPTAYLGYTIGSHTNGLADLSYRVGDPRYDIKHHRYPAASEGSEQYYGRYDLSRTIEINSKYEKVIDEESWLPCCSEGWIYAGYAGYPDILEMGPDDAEDIFDCHCARASPYV